jgi:hypothetical protein
MHARLLLLCMSLLTSTAACRPQLRTSVRPPLCAVTLPPSLVHATVDTLPASLWFGLLIKGYAGTPGTDAVDCAGDSIAWAALSDGCGDGETARPLRRGPVRDDELLLRHAGDDYWFAWAPLWKLDDGTAQGPLAIAQRRGDRLEVHAIGTVRGYPRHARIAMHRMGASYLLSVEGEHCPRPDACARGVRLATLARQRFAARPLRAASTRTCLSPAWFPLREQVTRRLDEHIERELTRDLALRFRADVLTVEERIVVRDRDRAQSGLPARLFRESASRIRVRATQGELLAEGQSLWQAIREQDAALDAVGP